MYRTIVEFGDHCAHELELLLHSDAAHDCNVRACSAIVVQLSFAVGTMAAALKTNA